MKYTIINLDTGKELATFSTKDEAKQYTVTNCLSILRLEAGGEFAFVRPPFTDATDLVLYVLPKNDEESAP